MCVAVAMKLPRDRKTGLPIEDAQWRLAKIRDRAYIPTYRVKRYSVKEVGASQLFLIDNDTDWTEGVSIHPDGSYLSMVNSALNNTSDKKDDGHSKKDLNTSVSNNGYSIRKALKSHNIENAVEILIENKLDGNILITDGDRLFVIESTIPSEVKDKYRHLKGDKRFEDIIPKEEFKTIIKEISDDYLVVRTNSGIFDESFGYIESDGDSFISAKMRREHTIAELEANVFEPIDLITCLSKLGRDEINENPFYRPIRKMGKAELKEDDVEIFSTAIIQTDPSGTMLFKPIDCKLDNMKVDNLINGKYLANLVVLPQNSKLFEDLEINNLDEVEKKVVEKYIIKSILQNLINN